MGYSGTFRAHYVISLAYLRTPSDTFTQIVLCCRKRTALWVLFRHLEVDEVPDPSKAGRAVKNKKW